MEKITKEQLEKRLADNLEKQEIYEAVREAVGKFKHYKQVNKRFTEYLDSQGFRAWINRGTWQELGVYKKQYDNRLAIIGGYEKNLTWDDIIESINNHKVKEYEQVIRNQIATLDADKGKLKFLCDIIREYREGLNNYRYELERFASDLEYVVK